MFQANASINPVTIKLLDENDEVVAVIEEENMLKIPARILLRRILETHGNLTWTKVEIIVERVDNA